MSVIPEHLPNRLTISLWDFSWYTQTMAREPFADLDHAFEEAAKRGYNTVRICAMPYTLFGPAAEGTLHLSNLGGAFGQRTRWYNCKGGAVLNGKEHLLELFRAAERHDCFVILSSWEYQQSPSFMATPDLWQRLAKVSPKERLEVMTRAMGDLVQFLKDNEIAHRIAYAELHNEVDLSKLAEVASQGEDPVAAQKPYLEHALEGLRSRHPDILSTACYAYPRPYRLREDLVHNLQVAHFHVYVYGVLGRLFDEAGLSKDYEGPFPNELAKSLLRDNAPPFEEWEPDEQWRLEATGVSRRLFYLHDWVDPERWDLFLYEHYHLYRESMRKEITSLLEAYANFAQEMDVPAVIGEGWVGYTPLLAGFEEGPVGKDICEFAVEECMRLGYWGTVLCSNCAPHHPFWADAGWQWKINQKIREGNRLGSH